MAPPGELYLRQGQSPDLNNADDILGVVREFGGAWEAVEERFACEIEEFSLVRGRTWRRAVWGTQDADPSDPTDGAWRNFDDADFMDFYMAETSADDHFGWECTGEWVHVDTYAWQLRQLSAIGLLLVGLAQGYSALDIYRQHFGAEPSPPKHVAPDRPADVDSMNEAAEDLLLHILNQGLEQWYPRVMGRLTDIWGTQDQTGPDGRPRYKAVGSRHSILSVGALQAFNDLVSETAFTTCAHCGQWYGKQIQTGRAPARSRTKGVIYCSRSCANAASQAKYRKRQKELKRAAEGGDQ